MCILWPVGEWLLAVARWNWLQTGCCTINLCWFAVITSRSLRLPVVCMEDADFSENTFRLINTCWEVFSVFTVGCHDMLFSSQCCTSLTVHAQSLSPTTNYERNEWDYTWLQKAAEKLTLWGNDTMSPKLAKSSNSKVIEMDSKIFPKWNCAFSLHLWI